MKEVVVNQLLTTLLELVGVGLIVVGLAMWSVPVALVAAGAALIGISYQVSKNRSRS